MSSIDFNPVYYIKANWFGRPETTDALGVRLGRLFDRLGELHETLKPWSMSMNEYGRFLHEFVPYEDVRHDLGAYIAHNISLHQDGSVDEEAGYRFCCSSLDELHPFGIVACVGATNGPSFVTPFSNNVDFQPSTCVPLDPAVVTYDLIRDAAFAMIACWEPRICVVKPFFAVTELEREGKGVFDRAWMTYVTASDVEMIDVRDVPIVHPTPDGGLLLSATDELFDAGKPSHFEGACAIARATRPLNATIPVVPKPDWPSNI